MSPRSRGRRAILLRLKGRSEGRRVGTETVVLARTDHVDAIDLYFRLGESRARELRRELLDICRRHISEWGGHEVIRESDGLLVAFPTARAAVSSLTAMHQRLELRNRGGADHLVLRSAISAGDVEREGARYVGSPVDEAAHLCAQASGGQILASEKVRLLIGPGHGLTLVPFLSTGSGPNGSAGAYEVSWEPIRSRSPSLALPLALQRSRDGDLRGPRARSRSAPVGHKGCRGEPTTPGCPGERRVRHWQDHLDRPGVGVRPRPRINRSLRSV